MSRSPVVCVAVRVASDHFKLCCPVQFDVDEYIKKEKKDINVVLKDLQELYSKYKFMESRLVQQKRNLLNKIPDIKSALQAVEHLISKQVCLEAQECHPGKAE